jgi:DNA-binding GntR family transcriptional regulator
MTSGTSRYRSQETLEHRTIEQMVVQRLRDAITQGRLVPGQKLVYADIAEQMNVSVTPVREAVKTLEALGLVTIRPHRTAIVSSLTEDQVQQLYALRLLLEGWATERTVTSMSPEDISHLKNVYEEMDRVVEVLNRNVNDVVRTEAIVSLQHLHTDFHSSIYAHSGNEYLDQAIRVLRSQVATYWPVINRYSIERVNISHRQHFDILCACEQKNPAEASQLMQKHLQGTVPWIIEHIRTVNTQSGEGQRRGKLDLDTVAVLRHGGDGAYARAEFGS